MIHLFKTCMITAFILGLTWSAPLRAQDQRYISIRNTDTIWLLLPVEWQGRWGRGRRRGGRWADRAADRFRLGR